MSQGGRPGQNPWPGRNPWHGRGRNPGGQNANPGGQNANPGGQNANPGGQNPAGAQNAAGQMGFLQWRQGVQLITEKELYFGDPALVGTFIGCRYLRSACCYFIDKFLSGQCYGGAFTEQDFLSKGGLFSMDIASHAHAGFNDLLIDLVALVDTLLPYYRDTRGVAALFIDHLHYIIRNPPQAVLAQGAIVFQNRFIVLIRYHFSYSPMTAVRVLFSALAKAIDYLGYRDAKVLEGLLWEAWNILHMTHSPFVDWRDVLKKNPLFFEILMFTDPVTKVRFLGYQNNPISLYKFGRNDDVHAPENTLLLAPVVPVQPTAPPQGENYYHWAYDPVQLNWQWNRTTPRGLWNWPTVPIHSDWQMLWGHLAPNMNPQASERTYMNRRHRQRQTRGLPPPPPPAVGQQMLSPDQPSLMLAKVLGVFFAHASSLILIRLQAVAAKYIDLPYELYKNAMDSIVNIKP